ncbi:MAG: raffinose synthase [Akkermansiaceae bacterium]|nr:raffinose synthase [Akkermansiaceae bacterium]
MKKLLIPAIIGFVCCAAVSAQEIKITSEPTGFIVEKGIRQKPDKAGFVLSREVKLPAFKRGAFYRPFSGGAARGNRVEAVAFTTLDELAGYTPPKTRKDHHHVQEGQFILLEVDTDQYLALLPMTSGKVYGQFFNEKGRLMLKTGNFGTQAVQGDIPLLIWAYGKSPYAATSAVWRQVIESGYVNADWRSNKKFPEEPYGYLGWCSWEFYKTRISEKIISNAFHTLEDSDAPFRWIMVDDGYLDEKGRRLLSFGVDKRKFPNGWKPIMDLKKDDKIKWVGIWRNCAGYMSGVSAQHTMPDLKPHLTKARKGGMMLPNGTKAAAMAFYDKMTLDTKKNGFNFTKVDFHTKAFDLYRGMPDPVGAMRANNEALDASTHEQGIPLLNCIAQPNINSLQTKYSAVTRSSPDYNQKDKDKNKCNTYQSFANHLWMGQTVWGDLDMFHTHDQRDVVPMSIARAISGGPVYVSDEPDKVVPGILAPFAYQDGKLLRTQAPATLLPESFFIHPFRDEEVFRVVAPLEDHVAAIALFNFSEAGKTLESTISAKDYPYAGELLQPGTGPWEQPEEGLLVYDLDQKRVVPLSGDFKTEVADFGAKLFLLYPKTQGWAVIGRTDKYLPSAAVKVKSVSEKEIVFTLKETGPLAIWSDQGAPILKGARFQRIADNLYLADLPIKAGATELTVTR